MAFNTIFIALGIPDNLKGPRLLDQPYPLAHTKHPLIHNLLQNHYRCNVNKSPKLKAS